MNKKKISILIPTYNRKTYLEHTLNTCKQQRFSDCEFLVIDDCSTDDTSTLVNEFSKIDCRFRYICNEKNLGMLGNFETGLSKCEGEYVLVLGADDGLMPDSLESISNILYENDLDLLTWPTPAYFYAGTKMQTSQIIFPKCLSSNMELEVISSDNFFKNNANNLAYVGDKYCPMLYVKSIAKSELVKKVISASGGKFYSCSTPDGYSAFALLSVIEKYHYIARPFTIHGVSPTSAGVNYVQAIDPKNDLSQKFFNDSKSRRLNKKLASSEYSPLISIMTADFLMTAQEVIKNRDVKVDIKNLIRKSIRELCDGLMSENKIPRELKIIHEIAKHNDLEDYFLSLCEKSKRNKRMTLEGDAISPSAYYINATTLKINNLVEAANYIDDCVVNNKKPKFKSFHFILNSLRYLIQGKTTKNKKLSDFLSI